MSLPVELRLSLIAVEPRVSQLREYSLPTIYPLVPRESCDTGPWNMNSEPLDKRVVRSGRALARKFFASRSLMASFSNVRFATTRGGCSGIKLVQDAYDLLLGKARVHGRLLQPAVTRSRNRQIQAAKSLFGGISTDDADGARTHDLLRDRQRIAWMDKSAAATLTGYYGLSVWHSRELVPAVGP
jgi:hypothetical protein